MKWRKNKPGRGILESHDIEKSGIYYGTINIEFAQDGDERTYYIGYYYAAYGSEWYQSFWNMPFDKKKEAVAFAEANIDLFQYVGESFYDAKCKLNDPKIYNKYYESFIS